MKKDLIYISENLKDLSGRFSTDKYDTITVSIPKIETGNCIFILDVPAYDLIKNKLDKKNSNNFIILLTDEVLQTGGAQNIEFISPQVISHNIFLSFIDKLFTILKLKKNLNTFIEAFDLVSELSRQELIDADRTRKAQEIVGELSRQELISAYKFLKARESVSELSRQELIDSKEIEKVWEMVVDYSAREIKNFKEDMKAIDRVSEFSRTEKIQQDKSIRAWSAALDLSRRELMSAYNKLRKLLLEKDAYMEKIRKEKIKKEKKDVRKKRKK